MSKFRALLLLHFQALLAALRVGGSKKRAVSGWVTLALMGVLCLYLSGVFTLAMARELAQAGMLPVLLLVMGAGLAGLLDAAVPTLPTLLALAPVGGVVGAVVCLASVPAAVGQYLRRNW